MAWEPENDPEAAELRPETLALDNYVLVNDVARPRSLALAPDVVVTGQCVKDGTVTMRRLTLEELAVAPLTSAECNAQASLQSNRNWFWFDVRNGVVAHIVGQYLP